MSRNNSFGFLGRSLDLTNRKQVTAKEERMEKDVAQDGAVDVRNESVLVIRRNAKGNCESQGGREDEKSAPVCDDFVSSRGQEACDEAREGAVN